MNTSQSWFVPLLAIAVLIVVIPLILLLRMWRRRARLSREERAEFAGAPMTRLQKCAWSGLAVGLLTIGSIAGLLNAFGVAEYWDNDDFRLVVVALFVAGLIACAGLLAGGAARLDERDRKVLSQAGTFQTVFIMIGMAGWLIAMGERFHDEGAVPTVYLYLMFGFTVLINFVGQFVGILAGYWLGDRLGQT